MIMRAAPAPHHEPATDRCGRRLPSEVNVLVDPAAQHQTKASETETALQDVVHERLRT